MLKKGEGSSLSLINGALCDLTGPPIQPVELSSLDSIPLHKRFKIAVCIARSDPNINGSNLSEEERKFFHPVDILTDDQFSRRVDLVKTEAISKLLHKSSLNEGKTAKLPSSGGRTSQVLPSSTSETATGASHDPDKQENNCSTIQSGKKPATKKRTKRR